VLRGVCSSSRSKRKAHRVECYHRDGVVTGLALLSQRRRLLPVAFIKDQPINATVQLKKPTKHMFAARLPEPIYVRELLSGLATEIHTSEHTESCALVDAKLT